MSNLKIRTVVVSVALLVAALATSCSASTSNTVDGDQSSSAGGSDQSEYISGCQTGEFMLSGIQYPTEPGWVPAAGQILSADQVPADAQKILGAQFGGDGVSTFGIPNQQSRQPGAVDSGGGAQWNLCLDGSYEPQGAIGQVRYFVKGATPLDILFLPADGSTVQCSDYRALCAVLGSTYGGDGESTSVLPNLQSDEGNNLPDPAVATAYVQYQGAFPDSYTGPSNSYAGTIGIMATKSQITDGSNFLLTDGRTLPVAASVQSESLFRAIGTKFGSGPNGFRIPNISPQSPAYSKLQFLINGEPNFAPES